MASYPEILHVAGSHIERYKVESMDEIMADPRGLLLMFEEPLPRAKYVMGLDASEGITGWTRGLRRPGDEKTDNGAIEIFKIDGAWEYIYKIENGNKVHDIDPITKQPKRLFRDLQVAEFAAPCDAVEIAQVANVLGRIYAGDAEDQCELIWEAWPGCGMIATQELLRLGYGNLWMWEYIDGPAEESNRYGWRSTKESQRLLWYRARRHLMSRQARIQSRFLLSEYANAEIDMEKMRARAAYGYHDDRFQAANMCYWAGHKWAYEVERTFEAVTTAPSIEYQRYAPTLGDLETYSDYRERLMEDWED